MKAMSKILVLISIGSVMSSVAFAGESPPVIVSTIAEAEAILVENHKVLPLETMALKLPELTIQNLVELESNFVNADSGDKLFENSQAAVLPSAPVVEFSEFRDYSIINGVKRAQLKLPGDYVIKNDYSQIKNSIAFS